MQLNRDGAQHFAAALTPNDLLTLEHALQNTQQHGPGRRVSGIAALSTLLSPQGSIGRVAASFLGPEARAVRALLFNKTAENNWALGWHQDRTIPVRERVETPGFTNWTVKAGMHHVEPPFDLLEGMLTLRVHLDPVGPRNAPLLIAPGSHRLGRIPEPQISETVESLGAFACLAERGDMWLYSTPILHASEAAAQSDSRRVLQVDYSAASLPGPLEWTGV